MSTQTAFREALLDAGRDMPAGLIDGAGRPAGRRYAVYRNNVAVSLREALATGFPAVAKLLGEENFDHVAGLFLRKSQPDSPLMMHYGAGFPEFLARFKPLRHIGYLSDVARLELAMRRSYHAADHDAVAPDAVAALGEDLMTTTFRLAPSAQLLRSAWPVVSVWRYTLRAGQAKPPSEAQDALILRAEYDPEPHILPKGGADFVRALAKGQSFAGAVNAGGPDLDLAAVLNLLLSQRALILENA